MSRQKQLLVTFASVCLDEIQNRKPNSPNHAIQKVAEGLPAGIKTREELEKQTRRIWSFLEEDEPFIMKGDTASAEGLSPSPEFQM
jgi:hypothetical protein